MLQKIKNVQNATELAKETQAKINGGIMIECDVDADCPLNWACVRGFCCPNHY
ncbi:hypothetical protein KORDIASMS9_03680 [Kordia sp. SMS9]|uniref:hypothetical protein n=1 Tax=Kordia sp. SMS9 TaxID=2282170 RepID=UPI000E1081A2|nr:hypothetical protein [Kordia sp. SMS9]AXG71423.1 hypothetical protein KORDIASMS9_03680 [Kordia sp. SMS9]